VRSGHAQATGRQHGRESGDGLGKRLGGEAAGVVDGIGGDDDVAAGVKPRPATRREAVADDLRQPRVHGPRRAAIERLGLQRPALVRHRARAQAERDRVRCIGGHWLHGGAAQQPQPPRVLAGLVDAKHDIVAGHGRVIPGPRTVYRYPPRLPACGEQAALRSGSNGDSAGGWMGEGRGGGKRECERLHRGGLTAGVRAEACRGCGSGHGNESVQSPRRVSERADAVTARAMQDLTDSTSKWAKKGHVRTSMSRTICNRGRW